jgi:heme-degrading monooxygenase HmoA
MSAIVVNHLHFSEAVDGLLDEIRGEFEPAFRGQPGFRHFWLVREADDRAAVIIEWESAEAAVAGSQAIGPTVFNRVIAHRLASDQVRSMGAVVVEIEAG